MNFRILHKPLVGPETSSFSGRTNRIRRTLISRQLGQSWAGMTTVFRPRLCSMPFVLLCENDGQRHPLVGADVFQGDIQLKNAAEGFQPDVPGVEFHGILTASEGNFYRVRAFFGEYFGRTFGFGLFCLFRVRTGRTGGIGGHFHMLHSFPNRFSARYRICRKSTARERPPYWYGRKKAGQPTP